MTTRFGVADPTDPPNEFRAMAGHSKWANIKHRKAAQDAKRGKVFSKLIKKISSAARRGGGDPDANPELRLMVDKARAVNMPFDNIERAILKATGQLEGVTYEDFSYEGYGPGGVAIQVEGATDNKNRTVAEVRHAFGKAGGSLGESGCVGWMFQARGVIAVDDEHAPDADALMEVALDGGAEDFEFSDGVYTITTAPADYLAVREALLAADYSEFATDEVTKIADTLVTPEVADAVRNVRLIELFEDHDDVQSVYSNLELSDEAAAALDD